MNRNQSFNYKQEAERYQHYYRELHRFYQKPITQVSAAVLFTLSTIIFFAVFAIKPTMETISELLRKIEDQKEVLAKAEKKTAALNTAKQQLDRIQAYELVLLRSLPQKSDIQNLLMQIESLAADTGIPIQSLRIAEVIYPEKKASDIEEIDFTIGYDSSYPVSRQFIDKLSRLPRYFYIETTTFQLKETTAASQESMVITTNLKCKAFKSAGTLQ